MKSGELLCPRADFCTWMSKAITETFADLEYAASEACPLPVDTPDQILNPDPSIEESLTKHVAAAFVIQQARQDMQAGMPPQHPQCAIRCPLGQV